MVATAAKEREASVAEPLETPMAHAAHPTGAAELVEEALRENESWLFAHRERPLEPVVGG